ncbi:hypothetical protein FVEN_g11113 [Fusarium venenatum]|uniref:Uncharacterized protein n=1 Tax=Fusarium venenatum TaxID=56646 RepID=A0A2L2T8R6_9HYPO|nr:uncharacterized protein FVRRES_00775 [Fusarium venenatum]KAG8350751.1 hypothetical protein FVEN_g11113 [Fusarium venenatum]KAH7006002.1 hypothetical protein EDB82DRAFT_472688 [Fusarium venenatum]CEI64263.1 unnamed protein product [Fusarium venenatum]
MPIFSYLCSWVKPRQSRSDEPSTSFSFGKKKRTKSALSKTDDPDHQRSTMIRKSLQSRTSSRTTARPEDNNNYDTEEEDSSTSLRTDWKAYEADIQRNKSTLMRSHPGVDRARIQTRAGSSSSRPQPQSFGSSSTNPYSPTSPTMSESTSSPASPGFGRIF